jgi:hypothetical protein
MKEATGELNMTVVTVIAVAAIGLLFYLVIWPMIQAMIVQQTCNTYGPDYKATKGGDLGNGSVGSAKVESWQCCNGSECIEME